MRARAGVEKGVRFGRPVVVVVNHDERSRQLQLHRGSKRGLAREDRKPQEEGEEDTVKEGIFRQQHPSALGKATGELGLRSCRSGSLSGRVSVVIAQDKQASQCNDVSVTLRLPSHVGSDSTQPVTRSLVWIRRRTRGPSMPTSFTPTDHERRTPMPI